MDLNTDALTQNSKTKRMYSRVFKICLLGAVVAAVIFAILKDTRLLTMIPIGLVILFGISSVVATFRPRKPIEVYEQFAQDNDFTFKHELNEKYWPPLIGNKKGMKSWVDFHMTGTVEDHTFKLFSFQHELSQGDSLPLFSSQWVLCFEFAKSLPEFLVDAKYNPVSLPEVFSNHKLLKLEGDFSDYFKVYCLPGNHIEVLSMLTPDVMYALREFWGYIDIIVSGKRVWLIGGDNKADDGYDMMELFDTASIMIPQLAHQARG